MGDRVFLQMASCDRKIILERHQFYFQEATKRLLSQFSDISGEAEMFMKEEFKRIEHKINPETGDPSDYFEWAHEQGENKYMLLDEMKQEVILGVIAGMYHRWDKELREWLVREINFTWNKKEVRDAIWAQNIPTLFELFESIGWDIQKQSFCSGLDAARLVVNVFKHGQGKSWNDLKKKYPEYVNDPFEGSDMEWNVNWLEKHVDYTHLKATNEDVAFFYKGINEFWEQIPKNTFLSHNTEIPKWLDKALNENA